MRNILEVAGELGELSYSAFYIIFAKSNFLKFGIFGRAASYDQKFSCEIGSVIAAAKKLRLRMPRSRVGQSSRPRPQKVERDLFSLKRTFA